MGNKEILEKALKKAQKNGFIPEYIFSFSESMGWTMVLRKKPKQVPGGLTANITYMQSDADIIFNHNFAKALWGEDNHTLNFPEGKIHMQSPLWQYHLQQMVISENPIKYLGENLDG